MSEKRVLIVDDSKDIGRMIAAALGTLDPGVQVKMMSSAEEAVLEITREPFDLLVIDIRLPGISGLDLTRRIRSRNPNLKIIQISGLDDPQVASEALQAGANAFFHKPISMSEFLKTCGVFLGLRSSDSDVQVAADFQAETQAGNMAEVLTSTRKALNATAVVMTDNRGKVLIQAGKLPDPNLEASLLPDLLEALVASAKVGLRLGEAQPEHVLGFKGPAFQVLAAPILAGFSLIIFLKAEKPSLRIAIAFEEALLAQHELHRLLQGGQTLGSEVAARTPASAQPTVLYTPPSPFLSGTSGVQTPRPQSKPLVEPVGNGPTKYSPPPSRPLVEPVTRYSPPPSKPLVDPAEPPVEPASAVQYSPPPSKPLVQPPETGVENATRYAPPPSKPLVELPDSGTNTATRYSPPPSRPLTDPTAAQFTPPAASPLDEAPAAHPRAARGHSGPLKTPVTKPASVPEEAAPVQKPQPAPPAPKPEIAPVGVPTEAPKAAEPTPAAAPQASLEESLDSLLRASADRKLEAKEIDAFWDDLTAQENSESHENTEMISYEQAIKMGLAPKDAGK
jgi:DNA-binding response OmpR family regulator